MPCLQATFNRVNFCIKKSVASNKPTTDFYLSIFIYIFHTKHFEFTIWTKFIVILFIMLVTNFTPVTNNTTSPFIFRKSTRKSAFLFFIIFNIHFFELSLKFYQIYINIEIFFIISN